MAKNCKMVIPVSFFSMTKILCCLFESLMNQNLEFMKQQQDAKDSKWILDNAKTESLFALALVWAFGGCLAEKDNKDYRKEFSSFFKNEFKGVKFPSKGSVFDYFV
jgi:dynein heavy chain